MDLTSFLFNLAQLDISPIKVKKGSGGNFTFNCSSSLKNVELVKLTMLKDNKEIVQINKTGKPSWDPKLTKLYNVTSDPTVPYLSLGIRGTDHAGGDYQCKVVYLNSTQRYDTTVQSNTIVVSSQTKNQLSLVAFLFSIIIVILIFSQTNQFNNKKI